MIPGFIVDNVLLKPQFPQIFVIDNAILSERA